MIVIVVDVMIETTPNIIEITDNLYPSAVPNLLSNCLDLSGSTYILSFCCK
jgi:hypothetical protein